MTLKLFPRTERDYPLFSWVPSLYISMGFPYIMVAAVAAIMYRNIGYSTEEVVIYTSQLYLPWVMKPLWAPLLERYQSTKYWVVLMQLIMMTGFALAAFSLPITNSLSVSLAFFWIIGFASATQDVAIDGIFMSSTSVAQQAKYAGVQNMCWSTGAILASGLLVSMSGQIKQQLQLDWKFVWMVILLAAAVIMGVSAIWHWRVLPRGDSAARAQLGCDTGQRSLAGAWAMFVRKPRIWMMLLVVFFYRFAEGFIEKLGPIFLLDDPSAGGLGLSNQALGMINGSFGTVAFIAGAVLGGLIVAKSGLRRSFVLLAIVLNVPHLLYLLISQHLQTNFEVVATAVVIEKVGYGMGSVGHMLYMVQQISPGPFRMAHYAFATSVMAACKWVTGWLGGPLFAYFGHDYASFFAFVSVMSIFPVVLAYFAPFDLTLDNDHNPAGRSVKFAN